jgi:hypothetical protein
MNPCVRFSLPLAVACIFGSSAPLRCAETDPSPEPKVTYSAGIVTLQKLADDLTRQTGVTVRAGSGPFDWPVRERKVIVAFRDLPLGVALSETARTLYYQLRKTEADGKPAYRIWQSPSERKYEADRLAEQTEAQMRATMRKRLAAFQDAETALAMSPADALKQRETNPWMAFLGGTESGRAYATILRNLPPDVREAILRGRPATLEIADLPPAVRSGLGGILPERARQAIAAQSGPEGEIYKTIVPARIVFQPASEAAGMGREAAIGATGMAVVLGEAREPSPDFDARAARSPFAGLGSGAPMASLPLVGGGTPMGKLAGRFLLRLNEGDDFQSAMQEIDAGMRNPPPLENPASIVPSSKPEDPRLLAEIEPANVKPDRDSHDRGAADLIRQLSAKTPLSYVLEFYPSESMGDIAWPDRKTPLYQGLDSLQLSGYAWEFGEGVVRIRPNDWAVQRSCDVPESFLADYRSRLKERGGFDLDALAAIAFGLTDGQIDRRFLLDRDLQPAREGLVSLESGHRALLRFYGGLDSDRRAALKTPEGLSFSRLSAGDWSRMTEILPEESGEIDARSSVVRLEGEDASGTSEAPGPDEAKIAVFAFDLVGDPPGPPRRVIESLTLPAIAGKRPPDEKESGGSR